MNANDLIEQFPNQQLITKSTRMAAGYIDDFHSHPWHQIVFPVKGLLQSNIGDTCAIVPHNGMLYIPSNTVHKSVAVTDTVFLAVYLNPDKFIQYSDRPKSCQVSSFMKELLLTFFDAPTLSQSESNVSNLLTVLRDQIEMAHSYEIPLLMPKDKRLLSIFSQLKQQPDLSYTLKEWAPKVGASERTLSRLCSKEFSQSFARWRQSIRLVLSLQMLDTDMSIQTIATSLGYSSDSAYTYAFKKTFNQTPSSYRRQLLKSASVPNVLIT